MPTVTVHFVDSSSKCNAIGNDRSPGGRPALELLTSTGLIDAVSPGSSLGTGPVRWDLRVRLLFGPATDAELVVPAVREVECSHPPVPSFGRGASRGVGEFLDDA